MGNSEHPRCRECRALNEPGALFCSHCGSSLAGLRYPGPRFRRRRVSAAGAVMAFALLLILLTAVFALGFIVYRTVKPGEETGALAPIRGTTASISAIPAGGSDGGAPSTGESAGGGTSSTVSTMAVRPRSASASSVLKATLTINYAAINVLDGDLATAWNEGAEGPGLGEWVRLDFSKPVTPVRIDIANGYQKDSARFKGNVRVKSMKLQYSNGSTQVIELLDTEDFQSVTTDQLPIEWIKITILSVYPDYVWEDAALSEVRILALAGQ